MQREERTLEKFRILFEACFYMEKSSVGRKNKTRLSSSANKAKEKGAMETNELRY
jgi:hypothetical protein